MFYINGHDVYYVIKNTVYLIYLKYRKDNNKERQQSNNQQLSLQFKAPNTLSITKVKKHLLRNYKKNFCF